MICATLVNKQDRKIKEFQWKGLNRDSAVEYVILREKIPSELTQTQLRGQILHLEV